MWRWLVLGCVALGCVFAPVLVTQAPAGQTQGQVVGVIESCKGSISGFKLTHAGQKGLPVKVLMRLWEGDQITAHGSGVLTVRYTDGTTEVIGKQKPHFTAELKGQPVRLADNLLKLFRWTDKIQSALGSLGTRNESKDRNEPLRWSVSVLSKGAAQVVRDERRLGVAWEGGKGPFHVTVKASGGEILLDERTKDREVLPIEPRKLSSGTYQVLLADTEKKQLEGSFTVVEPSVLPVIAPAPEWLGRGPARAFRASELASKEDQRWCYEAYLSLIGLEEDFEAEGKDSWPAHLRRNICL
jgi:hypothetical protein